MLHHNYTTFLPVKLHKQKLIRFSAITLTVAKLHYGVAGLHCVAGVDYGVGGLYYGVATQGMIIS